MGSLVGTTIGQFTITALLGEGGMADVYRARQESLKRDVALKVLRINLASSAEFLQRFEREARTIARLSQSHIVKIIDYGEDRGVIYLAMELLPGGSLGELIRNEGALAPQRASAILDQVASALDYAHRNGIVHRDLKPQNILFSDAGDAVLTDFGIAKLLHEASSYTMTGTVIGTPAYMAPEQWNGQHVDSRTDVYALGAVMYEMLTGQVPFAGSTPASVMRKHLQDVPPPLRLYQPELPVELDTVVQTALNKSPDARYQSAGEFAAAFKAAVRDYERRPLSGGTPDRTRLQPEGRVLNKRDAAASPRRGLLILAAALVALALLVVGGLTLLPGLISQVVGPVATTTPTPNAADLTATAGWQTLAVIQTQNAQAAQAINATLTAQSAQASAAVATLAVVSAQQTVAQGQTAAAEAATGVAAALSATGTAVIDSTAVAINAVGTANAAATLAVLNAQQTAAMQGAQQATQTALAQAMVAIGKAQTEVAVTLAVFTAEAISITQTMQADSALATVKAADRGTRLAITAAARQTQMANVGGLTNPTATARPATTSASSIPEIPSVISASMADTFSTLARDGRIASFQGDLIRAESNWSLSLRGQRLTEDRWVTPPLADFIYAADIIGGQPADRCGLELRVSSGNLYGVFVTRAGNIHFWPYDSAKRQWNTSQTTTSPAIRTGDGQANRLVVLAQGSTFRVYVNGTFVQTFTDTRIPTGNIGVVAWTDNPDASAGCTYPAVWAWALSQTTVGKPQVTNQIVSVTQQRMLRYQTVLNTNDLIDFMLLASVEFGPGTNFDYCGVLFRANFDPANNDNNAYYQASIERSQNVVIHERSSKVWQPDLKYTNSSSVKAGQGSRNELLLIVRGDTATLIVNGQVVVERQDPTLKRGALGLVAGMGDQSTSTSCRFRNVWVWKVN